MVARSKADLVRSRDLAAAGNPRDEKAGRDAFSGSLVACAACRARNLRRHERISPFQSE